MFVVPSGHKHLLEEQTFPVAQVPQLNNISHTLAIPHSHPLTPHCCKGLQRGDGEGDWVTRDFEGEGMMEGDPLSDALEVGLTEAERLATLVTLIEGDPEIERDWEAVDVELAFREAERVRDSERVTEGVFEGVKVAVVVVGIIVSGMHRELMLHISFSRQVPQSPPQPSSPHS